MSSKMLALAALLSAGIALAWIAFGSLGENLVYYWSPTEMRDAGPKANGATIRLGGQVEAGSLKQEGNVLRFRVTDGTVSTAVEATEIPPAMFREGIGVVVEGSLGDAGVFKSKRLMVKHDNEYRAPADGAMPDKTAMFGTLEGEPKPE
jgi:cytochrome c-type biogenesis protein CcmE